MIKGQEIFKYIDPQARYIAKDGNGAVYWFGKNKPYYIDKTKKWCPVGLFGRLGKIEIEEFKDKELKECILEKEPNYEEWIGYLCWFYDEESEQPQISVLKKIVDECSHPYLSNGNCQYKHCRPVRPSEIKFFEEK